MLAIPNPRPERPPLAFFDDLASFLTGVAVFGGIVTVLLLILAATGVFRLAGVTAQRSVTVIGSVAGVTIVLALLAVLGRG